MALRYFLDFSDLCNKVQERIEAHYGIRVLTCDVPDPFIGDLDGAVILINCAVSVEQRLFLLAHLFGHTVQWNVSAEAIETGRPRCPPVQEALLPGIMAYEWDAAGYGITLFREIGAHDADQWLADYTACDLSYLEHYYRTGEKRDPLSFWRYNAAPVEPRAIPVFAPRRVALRSAGVVI